MDLIEALDAASIEYRETGAENEIVLCCPFCVEQGESPDERFRLGINTKDGAMNCFNCGKKGRGEFSFQELQRVLDTGEIEEQQEGRKHKKKTPIEVALPDDFEILKQASSQQDHWNNVAYRYIKIRGVTLHQIEHKKIGYSMVGDFHHRIVFPVYYKGKLQGLVGRDFTEKQELKYKNSIGDKTIYNLPDKPQKSICLVEGIFDALAVERGAKSLGIDSGGLLGHSLKDAQLELIESYKTIYLWLDPDVAGLKGTLKIAEKLGTEFRDKVVRVILPKTFKHPEAEDYDPSDMDRIEVTRRLSKAKVFTEELQMKLRAWMAFDE